MKRVIGVPLVNLERRYSTMRMRKQTVEKTFIFLFHERLKRTFALGLKLSAMSISRAGLFRQLTGFAARFSQVRSDARHARATLLCGELASSPLVFTQNLCVANGRLRAHEGGLNAN